MLTEQEFSLQLEFYLSHYAQKFSTGKKFKWRTIFNADFTRKDISWSWILQLKGECRAGEMAQWLRSLTALLEVL